METLTGLGLMLGPFVGAGIFALGGSDYGYQLTFYVMGGTFLFSIIPTMYILPKDTIPPKEKRTLSLFKILFERNILLTFLLAVSVSSGMTYINPLFTNHL